MDDQLFQWMMLALMIIVAILVLVNPGKTLTSKLSDRNLIDFIYEQCMNDTSINLTFTTGQFYLAKENNTCLLGRGLK